MRPQTVEHTGTRPPTMLENVREDFAIHERSLMSRAFWAMLTYRFGRWSLALPFRPARWAAGKVYGALYLLTEILTGVHMPREVTIGRRFHIVHADGPVSIHPATVIGDDVGIMHNVTIGMNMGMGVPRIGNRVFIGVGAAVLGDVTVGDGARIAANSLVIADVPPDSVAMGVPARIWKNLPSKAAVTTAAGTVAATTDTTVGAAGRSRDP
jgi:serine O-acetyltransferase